MPDQRKVELLLGIRTTGAADASAGIDSISKVAGGLKENLTALQRADVFKDLGVTAAQVAAQTGQLDEAVKRLSDELKKAGASEKEIRKVSQAFDKEVTSIQKAEAAAARKVAGDIARAEKSAAAELDRIRRVEAAEAKKATSDAARASKALERAEIAARKENARIDATKRQSQIDIAEIEAYRENAARDSSGGSGGLSFGQKLTRLGAQGRNLPSTQIPGLPIATDAISNIVRLSGALLDIAGKSKLVVTATNLLTPALGAEAAATLGAAAPAAAFVVAFGAIALALKSLTDATGQNAEAITAYAEAQRALNADIVSGLTTEEARKKIEDLNESRRLEEELLAKNKKAYEAFEQQATEAGVSVDDFGSTLGKVIFGANAVSDVAKAISNDEQSIADQIAASEKNIKAFSASTDTLTTALDSGRLAANDAAEAEKKLAEERSKAALTSADNAGKQLQAEQKALGATEEQNKKRLESIDDEKAVIDTQIETLEASGVTSEEVTAKIAALKDQLGLLGKESDFINKTALEASRLADAEKKAKKDAEDAEKKATQAQEQYTKAVQNAATAYKQSVQDIGTRLTQTLSDNTLKLNRDMTDLSSKFARDQYDLQIKSNRAERDALQDQINDIEDIRRDAAKDEQDALRDGDFKALFLAREKGAEALQQEQKDNEREREKRRQNAEYALQDLQRANDRQRMDRIIGYERQNIDAHTAQQRELQQAQLTRQRSLQAATQAYNAELSQLGMYLQARMKMEQNFYNQSLGMAAGGTRTGANASSPFGAFQGTFTAMGRVIRK